MSDELVKRLREIGKFSFGWTADQAADRIEALTAERDARIEALTAQLTTARADYQIESDLREVEEALLKAAEAERDRLREAAIALRDDMLERSRAGMDVIRGEQYRIVNAGAGVWMDFCAALKGETP